MNGNKTQKLIEQIIAEVLSGKYITKKRAEFLVKLGELEDAINRKK